jgi:hypothetical protein
MDDSQISRVLIHLDNFDDTTDEPELYNRRCHYLQSVYGIVENDIQKEQAAARLHPNA